MAKNSKKHRQYSRVVVTGDQAQILMPGGMVAIVDLALVPLVETYQWRGRHRGTNTYAYAVGGNRVLLHRLVMGLPALGLVDHLSGDGLDCRRANLRLTTVSINQFNSKNRPNKTGARGVTLDRSGRFRAQIGLNNRIIYLGSFKTLPEAVAARQAAESKYLPGGLPLGQNPHFRRVA